MNKWAHLPIQIDENWTVLIDGIGLESKYKRIETKRREKEKEARQTSRQRQTKKDIYAPRCGSGDNNDDNDNSNNNVERANKRTKE